MYRSLAIAAALGIGAVLVGPIACRQIAGIGSSPQTDLAASACGLPFGTPSCAACAMDNCCAESTACAADPSCEPYGSCMGQCKGDPRCWAQCLIDHPTEAPSASALDACMGKSCETACGLTCGAFAGWPLDPDAAVACQACLVSNVCTETRACATSSDCNAVAHCVPLCQTLDCMGACEIAHGVDPAYGYKPDGGTPSTWQTFSTARSACNVPCASGGDWSCVGHVSWPPPKTVSATYHFWIKDYATLKPIEGATVSLCGAGDPSCAGFVARDTTDSSGAVSLPFQNVMSGGQQGSGFAGFLLVTAPTLVDEYYYWGFPISGSQIDSYGEPLTPDELLTNWANVNVKPDSTRGTLSVAVYDCAFAAAAGVRVTVDTADMDTRAFTTSGVFTTTTDKTGILVFANVPKGTVQVTATPLALGVTSGTVAAVVHAGAITQVLLFPTP